MFIKVRKLVGRKKSIGFYGQHHHLMYLNAFPNKIFAATSYEEIYERENMYVIDYNKVG